jgi:hypothetical protein
MHNQSRKALDPEWPIREADIARRGWHGRKVPCKAATACEANSISRKNLRQSIRELTGNVGAGTRAAVKKHPEYCEHAYFLPVETAFKNWEAMQNVGR